LNIFRFLGRRLPHGPADTYMIGEVTGTALNEFLFLHSKRAAKQYLVPFYIDQQQPAISHIQ
jgi:hypothetical protein